VASPGFGARGSRSGRRRAKTKALEGVDGVGIGREYPLPSRRRGLGSVVSSYSGVRGEAPAENDFHAF